MTTATLEKDEDLIILSDDSSSDNSILDFNFDVKTEDSNLTTDSIMNFGDDTKTEDISFDFDLGNETTKSGDLEMFDNDIFEEKKLVESEKNDINFGFGEETSGVVKNEIIEPSIVLQEEKISNNLIEKSFNRNDILDEAISKMQTRKESILSIKSSKQSKVDELNEQIKRLKKEVSDFELEIKDLEKEDLTLDLDISSIEKMKASIGEITNDRQRKHNLDNIKNK